jgi:hypothetical protein
MVYVTVHAESVSPAVLETVGRVIALGERPDQTIAKFARAINATPPEVPVIERLPTGTAILWKVGELPIEMTIDPPRGERQRHSRKYAEGNLGPDRAFVFRGPDGALNLPAHNLMLFLLLGDGVDDATWTYHLERGDYSKWFKTELKDTELSAAAAKIEQAGLPVDESRARIRTEIEQRYTLPADAPSGVVDPVP